MTRGTGILLIVVAFFNKKISVKVCPCKDMGSTAAWRSGRHGKGGLGVAGAGEMGRGRY